MLKKISIFIIISFLFFSCASKEQNPNIQDIVNLWTDIEKHFSSQEDFSDINFIESINSFYSVLKRFEKSDLFRTYSLIPYPKMTERSLMLRLPKEITEVRLISELALEFQGAIQAENLEKAHVLSSEISANLIRLLMVDAKTEYSVGLSYWQLLFTLIAFIGITSLLIWALYKSLLKSLKREQEGTQFSHSYILAQEEERARISRELHDTIIQDMRYLLLESERMAHSKKDDERKTIIGQTLPMMASLIRRTREICNSLIPPDFRFSELPDAIRQLCLNFEERTGIDCRAEIDEICFDFLSLEKRLQIFRIVQEALTNIEKHSQAKVAIVTMREGFNGIIFIGISDDGIGFTSPLDNNGDIQTMIDRSHIGIVSMKERAAILGGSFKINTEEGEGSLVCLEIPIGRGENNGSIIS